MIEITEVLWLFQVAEWTDEGGFQPVAAKYTRLKPQSDIERNRTYIVTTIIVSCAQITPTCLLQNTVLLEPIYVTSGKSDLG